MIRDLQQAGVTQVAIARYVGRSQAWVSEVATGRYKSLEWKDGESLRRLHAETIQEAA